MTRWHQMTLPLWQPLKWEQTCMKRACGLHCLKVAIFWKTQVLERVVLCISVLPIGLTKKLVFKRISSTTFVVYGRIEKDESLMTCLLNINIYFVRQGSNIPYRWTDILLNGLLVKLIKKKTIVRNVCVFKFKFKPAALLWDLVEKIVERK